MIDRLKYLLLATSWSHLSYSQAYLHLHMWHHYKPEVQLK